MKIGRSFCSRDHLLTWLPYASAYSCDCTRRKGVIIANTNAIIYILLIKGTRFARLPSILSCLLIPRKGQLIGFCSICLINIVLVLCYILFMFLICIGWSFLEAIELASVIHTSSFFFICLFHRSLCHDTPLNAARPSPTPIK